MYMEKSNEIKEMWQIALHPQNGNENTDLFWQAGLLLYDASCRICRTYLYYRYRYVDYISDYRYRRVEDISDYRYRHIEHIYGYI